MSENFVLVYWRRIGSPPFPAASATEVEVCTPDEYAAEYGDPPPRLGPDDAAWYTIVGTVHDIDEQLGLCGDVMDIVLVADAMCLSVAIHTHLGLPIEQWDEECLWRKLDSDPHSEDDAAYYFSTIAKLYGAETEAAARRRYGSESP